MSKMVSARIPSALYEQASIQLAQMGSSPSALVKAAFEYLLEEHALPTPPKTAAARKRRTLSPQKREELRRKINACKLPMDIPSDIAYDKKIITDARIAKYEALG